ncbi:hypothetical protein V1477_005052 [Vespula maculifrons]|uniref:Uncharacterized protein n=1 Tax=Vespula maculifrons TaxID=7453 RepID=A0ABD2CNI7_VESMC
MFRSDYKTCRAEGNFASLSRAIKERVRSDTDFDQREDNIYYNRIANEDRFTIGWVGHQCDIHIMLPFDRSQLKGRNWGKPTMDD